MRCWWCGVEPEQLLDITRLGDAEPRSLPVWPGGDHHHSEKPPMPGELLAYGSRAFDRIVEIAAE